MKCLMYIKYVCVFVCVCILDIIMYFQQQTNCDLT
jgi:hypothetical protein